MKYYITQTEFTKWIAYYTYQEPDEHEIQLAVLSNMISAALGSKKTKVEDYLVRKPAGQQRGKRTLKALGNDKIKNTFAGFAKHMD